MAREHYRCPMCGKLSQPASFGIENGEFYGDTSEQHEVEVATQHFIGRPVGFYWQKEPAPEDVVRALRLAARATYTRLSEMLGQPPEEENDE